MFQVKKKTKINKHQHVLKVIIYISDFTFITEISLIFFHANDQKVNIFGMRFLNLVHCVWGGKILYKVACL